MALIDWLHKAGVPAPATIATNQKAENIAIVAGAKHKKNQNDIKAALSEVSGLPALSANCPLLTGGSAPYFCKFEKKLFSRLIIEGTLPVNIGGCPFRRICVI